MVVRYADRARRRTPSKLRWPRPNRHVASQHSWSPLLEEGGVVAVVIVVVAVVIASTRALLVFTRFVFACVSTQRRITTFKSRNVDVGRFSCVAFGHFDGIVREAILKLIVKPLGNTKSDHEGGSYQLPYYQLPNTNYLLLLTPPLLLLRYHCYYYYY